MNVTELRTELQARSKDTTGLKSELKARLIACLAPESPDTILVEDLSEIDMPKPLDPGTLSATGCAYGPACVSTSQTTTKHACDVCGINLHHMCMSGHPLLKCWVAGRLDGQTSDQVNGINESMACLDCALLCGVVQNKVGMNLVKKYTDQVTVFTKPTPRVVTTLLASKSLKIWPGDHGSNDVCETCNLGGDLLSCSFCNVSYHNEAPCLQESLVIPVSLMNSESYEWPCPTCFKQAVNTHLLRQKRVHNTHTTRGGAGAGEAYTDLI